MLRWFQQVADGATVTEVADLWMVSQPKVSRDLMALQREVGAPLLVKSGRVLRLTHAGAVFKKHVDAIVNRLDDALAELAVDPLRGQGPPRGPGLGLSAVPADSCHFPLNSPPHWRIRAHSICWMPCCRLDSARNRAAAG